MAATPAVARRFHWDSTFYSCGRCMTHLALAANCVAGGGWYPVSGTIAFDLVQNVVTVMIPAPDLTLGPILGCGIFCATCGAWVGWKIVFPPGRCFLPLWKLKYYNGSVHVDPEFYAPDGCLTKVFFEEF